MPYKKLYIIGNGFDLHHGIKSSYNHFHNWLKSNESDYPALDIIYSYFPADTEFWKDFENNLSKFNITDYAENEAKENYPELSSDNYARELDMATYQSEQDFIELVKEIRRSFHDWICNLNAPKSDKRIKIDKTDAFFINFNYTQTLETFYGIPSNKILHIHGCVDIDNDFIFGHGDIVQEPIEDIPATCDTEEKLQDYYESHNDPVLDNVTQTIVNGVNNYLRKDVEGIIDKHYHDFSLLTQIEEIYVYGWSFSHIDTPYLDEILKHNEPDKIKWTISWLNPSDQDSALSYLSSRDIDPQMITFVKLNDLVDKSQLTIPFKYLSTASEKPSNCSKIMNNIKLAFVCILSSLLFLSSCQNREDRLRQEKEDVLIEYINSADFTRLEALCAKESTLPPLDLTKISIDDTIIIDSMLVIFKEKEQQNLQLSLLEYRLRFDSLNLYAYEEIGTIYYAKQEYEKSLQYTQKELYIYQHYSKAYEIETLLDIYYNLSYIYTQLGSNNDVVLSGEEWFYIKYGSIGCYDIDDVRMLNVLAHAYLQEDNPAKSEELYLQSYNYCRTHPVDLDAYIYTARDLSSYYRSIANYDEAIKILLPIQNLFEPHDLALFIRAEYYAELARIYFENQDFKNSLNYDLKALRIYENESVSQDNNAYTSLLNNVGNDYCSLGDYQNAIIYLQKAIDIRKKINGEKSLPYCNSLFNLGYIYYEWYRDDMRKRNDKGNIKYLNKSIKLFKQAENIYIHNSKRDEYFEPRLYNGLYWAYFEKSLYYNNSYRFYIYSDIAMEYFQKEVKFIKDDIRKHFQYLSAVERENMWMNVYGQFVSGYASCMLLHAYNDIMYDNVLYQKGLLLRTGNEVKNAILRSEDTLLLRKYNEYVNLNKQLIEEHDDKEWEDSLKTKINQLDKYLTKRTAIYRETKEDWDISWKDVNNALTEHTWAVEFVMVPILEPNGEWWHFYTALLMNNGGKPSLYTIIEAQKLHEIIWNTGINNIYEYDDIGKSLYETIWGELLQSIPEGDTIYFSPVGILNAIALESLPIDMNKKIGDKYTMIRTSSSREIIKMRTIKEDFSSIALFGGILYDESINDMVEESVRHRSEAHRLPLNTRYIDRGRANYLLGAKMEIEKIALSVSCNEKNVVLYSASTATEEAIKSLSGGNVDVIHIATHGFFWGNEDAQRKEYITQQYSSNETQGEGPMDPLQRCGLLMAGANIALSGHSDLLPDDVEDGILTGSEIADLDLSYTSLVVLSACETGVGEASISEGVYGLQRAFKQAGVGTIIMSLWKVDDFATQLLMTEFYRNWITNHQSKREAFHNAQNTVRSQYEEPVYWAGFIMLD